MRIDDVEKRVAGFPFEREELEDGGHVLVVDEEIFFETNIAYRELAFVGSTLDRVYYVARTPPFRSAGIVQTLEAVDAMVRWYFNGAPFPSAGIVEGKASL